MDYLALKLASKRTAKSKQAAPAAKPRVAATSLAKPTAAAISGPVHAKVTAAPKAQAAPAVKVAAKEAPGSIWAQAHANLQLGEAK